MAAGKSSGTAAARVPGARGLRVNAVELASSLSIALSSTAAAYTLAATLGVIAAVHGMGKHAPPVLLVAFMPMVAIAVAFRALNRADPDCGTTLAWVSRAGTEAGLVRRCGERRRRRDRRRDPLGSGRQVLLLAVRVATPSRLHARAHTGGRRVHRGVDLGELSRHQARRSHPTGHDRHRDRDRRPLCRRRAREGVRRRRASFCATVARVHQPVRAVRRQCRPGSAPGRVRLLGGVFVYWGACSSTGAGTPA